MYDTLEEASAHAARGAKLHQTTVCVVETERGYVLTAASSLAEDDKVVARAEYHEREPLPLVPDEAERVTASNGSTDED